MLNMAIGCSIQLFRLLQGREVSNPQPVKTREPYKFFCVGYLESMASFEFMMKCTPLAHFQLIRWSNVEKTGATDNQSVRHFMN